ncbi:hypothetical protein GCM10011519_01080 [Marmoricola endophyticus]|uniref:Uncharacterized protein n=2 Tax=Marmoricola endophyticus TaxID=2040280 RepID=A0A917B9I7_9ACTN|nr:hypothetical protein GCM10011519_01080 [Marmoricola endophyticus]
MIIEPPAAEPPVVSRSTTQKVRSLSGRPIWSSVIWVDSRVDLRVDAVLVGDVVVLMAATLGAGSDKSVAASRDPHAGSAAPRFLSAAGASVRYEPVGQVMPGAGPTDHPGRARERSDAMTVRIDCDTCLVRGLSCHDCVVTVLLGPTPGLTIDDDERQALDALAGSGLVPPLRMVHAVGGPEVESA